VAVGAQEREILKAGLLCTDHVQGQDMMALDVATATVAVRLLEVKAACLAGQEVTAAPSALYFPLAEASASLACHVTPDQ